MKRSQVLMASVAFVVPAFSAVHPLAHYHLMGEGGIRDTLAPAELPGRIAGAPTLLRKGMPKIMSSSPEPRRHVADSSVKFEEDDQCYSTEKNLANGNRFVVEVWVRADRANDPGLHTVLANGTGALGFLIVQCDDQWQVFVGGVGGTALGKVTAEKWTHLAVVREAAQCSAWVDGARVAELPELGGGIANFALGATAPGKESFRGWISEARVSTFEPGEFEAADLLLDEARMKSLREAEQADRIRLLEDLKITPGIRIVDDFAEAAVTSDWLIAPADQAASVQLRVGRDAQSVQVLITNGLVSRLFHITDHNLGCISFRRADKDIEFVRAIKPEARICLDDKWFEIGGLTGAPDQAFFSPSWYPMLRSKPDSFRLVGMEVGACVEPYQWQPKCHAPKDLAWPAKGRRLSFRFAAPGESECRGASVIISYEIYEGIPVMMKTFRFVNKVGREVILRKFESEHLAVQPSNSRMMHVESDYSFALANATEQGSGLGIHVAGGDPKFYEYSFGGGTTRFVRDPEWSSMATLNQAEDLFLGDPQSALLLSRPTVGPNWTVKNGESFDAFRTFVILNDSTEKERFHLAQRRFYRKLAPQTNEKLFEVHAPATRDREVLRPLIDQMAELGFGLLQAPEHPGNFNYADPSEDNIGPMKEICEYAKARGIRVGAYQLMMASQGWGRPEDNFNCISPATGRPGSLFGQSACGASAWADMYYNNMWKTIEATGMGGFKPDGPYHGDPCAATDHPYHKGLEDSQWAQWKWMCKVLHEGQRRNLYLTVPDWYFLNGQVCTGMGYREATDNIEIGLQTLLYRQYIYDATWHKTAQMGWVNLNTEVLPGGMEKNLDKYERTFFGLLASGAQVWVRGLRLYDGPESRRMLQKWMAWYRLHEEVILGDIIHLRRPDGRGLDYYLHVNPGGREKGMLLVFNPLDRAIKKELTIPLYYTGLTDSTTVRERDGDGRSLKLGRDYEVKVTVELAAGGFDWLTFE